MIPSQNNPVDGEPFMPRPVNADPLLKDPDTGRTFHSSELLTPSAFKQAEQGTPRTDAAILKSEQFYGGKYHDDEYVEPDFARTLEKENNALRARILDLESRP